MYALWRNEKDVIKQLFRWQKERNSMESTRNSWNFPRKTTVERKTTTQNLIFNWFNQFTYWIWVAQCAQQSFTVFPVVSSTIIQSAGKFKGILPTNAMCGGLFDDSSSSACSSLSAPPPRSKFMLDWTLPFVHPHSSRSSKCSHGNTPIYTHQEWLDT